MCHSPPQHSRGESRNPGLSRTWPKKCKCVICNVSNEFFVSRGDWFYDCFWRSWWSIKRWACSCQQVMLVGSFSFLLEEPHARHIHMRVSTPRHRHSIISWTWAWSRCVVAFRLSSAPTCSLYHCATRSPLREVTPSVVLLLTAIVEMFLELLKWRELSRTAKRVWPSTLDEIGCGLGQAQRFRVD